MAFFLHGLLLSFFLLRVKTNRSANFYLLGLILLFSYNLFEFYLTNADLIYRVPFLYGVWVVFPLLYGPLFYLYTEKLTGKKPAFNDLYHFAFALFFLLYMIPSFYIKDLSFKMSFPVSGSFYDYFWSFSCALSGLFYSVKSIKRLLTYKKNIADVFSNTDKVKLVWLQNLSFLRLFCGSFSWL
jgi:hypothetical protein